MDSALARLVDELTTSGEPRLDAAKMRALKRECRASEEQLDCAYRLLMAQLGRAHAQVRLSTFQAMEQLFARSHHFRSLLVSDFQDFLALTLGTEHARPLPPPRETAQRLKRATLQAVQGWVAKYGPAYKKLELGFHFLRHNKQVDFQDVDVRTPAERKRAEEKQKRLERIYKERAEQAANDMEEMSEEIRCCLTEVDSCFRLLVPFDLAEASRQSGEGTPAPEEEEQPCCSKSLPPCAPCPPVGAHQTASKPASEDSDGDEDGEENPVLEDGDGGLNGFVRCHGLGSYKYTLQVELCADSLRVQEDENNQAIVHSARDALKLIQNKFLPAVGSWVQLFTRAGARVPLEDAIRLKVELEAMLRRGQELAIHPDVSSGREAASEDEDEDFVEVPEKEGYEPCIPAHLRPEYGRVSLSGLAAGAPLSTGLEAAQGSQVRKDEEAQDPTSAAAQPHSLRGRVLPGARAARGPQEAGSLAGAPVPVVPFGLDLCYWGQEPPSSRVLRADPEHRFWRPLEMEADGQAHGEPEPRGSRHITFAGTFQPVQHRCRAPKPDGRLCERQDRLKCPFHGKIIPRDEVGQPLDPDDRAREQQLQEQRQAGQPGWKDPEFLRDVEAATGVDLGSAHGRGRGRGRWRKHPGLADLKCQANTSRARLAKKVLAKASVQRVAAAMNKIDQKKHEKFQNQFNYALK
ncbi:UV-stimulated scaffold protein A isoform X1 [Erinaceus europaeus]|uniref:UV-stimulated scaffold protein A n=1 Tax=Erinaceus europaeus TaxID=9365 RepID=A0ABM3X696_ERIEU|nr:UV-stimulated scaffold protein A isoform X1 [Erinaceus europaeus]